MTEIFNYRLGPNVLADYLSVILIFLLLLLVFKIFHDVILNRLEKLALRTKTDLDEIFIHILRKFRPPFYLFLAFYFSLRLIALPPAADTILFVVLVIWVVYQAVVSANILVDYAVKKYRLREESPGTRSAIDLLGKIAKGVLWVVAILFILSNLGINITSLVAGLGIGGVAVALALQSVLSDLFSSFAIYFDKPFEPGDFIIVGDDLGVVEHIGIKTTRIRALRGEEVVISNQELTNARIHNFKKLAERRVVFEFGVKYDTPTEKLREIPSQVKKIIENVDKARFDRAHFHRFGESSLDFEVVYYLQSSDYNIYMDIHQEIHLEIKDALDSMGISIAFPSRTVYLE